MFADADSIAINLKFRAIQDGNSSDEPSQKEAAWLGFPLSRKDYVAGGITTCDSLR